jgi:hypothetical protein
VGLEKMKTYGIAIGKPMAVRVSMPGQTGSIARKPRRSLEDRGCLGMSPMESARHEGKRGRIGRDGLWKIGTGYCPHW